MASDAEPGRRVRLLVQSDQHIEQSDWSLPRPLPPHDVAVFPGDLSSPLTEALRLIARERDAGIGLARHVVFVPGNHEFYGVEMQGELAEGRRLAGDLGIHLLDGDAVVIHGVRFLGATLWTDYALYGTPSGSMGVASVEMNDHRWIGWGAEPFTPTHARAIHEARLGWLDSALAEPHAGPTVVVTHHCPSPRSVHRRFKGDPLNPAFASNLEDLMLRHRPALWLHGHTHASFDYRVGDTRVLCNPKGYGPNRLRGIENIGFDQDLVVEVTA